MDEQYGAHQSDNSVRSVSELGTFICLVERRRHLANCLKDRQQLFVCGQHLKDGQQRVQYHFRRIVCRERGVKFTQPERQTVRLCFAAHGLLVI